MRFLLISLSGPVGICVRRLRRRMLVVLVRGCVNLHVEVEERQHSKQVKGVEWRVRVRGR
jgi:hypothetical protein